MSKVFQSSSISKILSTNQLNTIEVNNDNIIEADSQLREVIQKGYLLTQINLSTIPDIIQDAIDKAILDAKTQTLADSLISTMRQTIENFDDGVYKKTYIDTTITYLEELLTQKASPEIVASIAEAKIAVATAEFATASQVGILSSRVGSSESEILNVKETINTKDTARATQIEELQASLNQTLANYSEAIDLTVDAEGNVKAQKIETLTTNIGLQLQEVNQLIVNTNNEWNAKSIKLITSLSGAITGYSFQNGSGVKSNFDIYADNFKISNSTNTKTPFRIVGNELLFDGKVSFSNITDKTSIVTMDNVQDAIDNNVTVIDGNKIATASIFSHQIDADAIAGKNITGGTIRGTQIIGSVIKGSFIDLTTTLTLTNWQYYTLSTIPSAYEANFAHHNEGSLTVDSQGYARLAGQQNFIIPPIIQSGNLWSGNLSNVHANPSLTINKVWELYSWNSYNIDTLQRSIRSDTQFTSNASLVFGGSISCASNLGGSGTDVNNYGTYSFRFIDTDIVVSIQASNGNQHNAEITNVTFNGVTVAYTDGRYGITPGDSDSAFMDYTTTIRGISVNFKTTFTGMAGYTFVFTATIANNSVIPNHTLTDLIKINSIQHNLNTAGSSAVGQTDVAYNLNFGSAWVM